MNSSSGSMTGLSYDSSQWPTFCQEEVATYEDILDYRAHLCNKRTSVESERFNIEFERNKIYLIITIFCFSLMLHQVCLFLLFLLLGGGHSFTSTVDSRTSVTRPGCCFNLIFQSEVAKTSSLCLNKN